MDQPQRTIIPSRECFALARARMQSAAPEIWGGYLRQQTVTLLVGESSAGKTVFLYNLAHCLAKRMEFFHTPVAKQNRILHLDFEGNDEIRDLNGHAIGGVDGWDIFLPPDNLFGLSPLKRGPALLDMLTQALAIQPYDLIIVDSLMEAYPVLDENSNDEANTQMVAWRRFAHATNTGVLLVHNTGLKNTDDPHKAIRKGLSRGASSRVDRADIVLNYTVEAGDERALTVVKSRSGNIGEQIRVRFAGDLGYEVTAAQVVNAKTISAAEEQVVQLMTTKDKEWSRHDIMAGLLVSHGSTQAKAIDRGLHRLCERTTLEKTKMGVYKLGKGNRAINQAAESQGSASSASLASSAPPGGTAGTP